MSSDIITADVGLAWAVKHSFVSYVRSLPDGQIQVADGAATTSDGEFYFPLVNVTQTADGLLSVQFGGVVTFTGHHGLLTVELRRPRIDLGVVDNSLFVAGRPAEVCLGRLALPKPATRAGVTMWSRVPVSVAREGGAVFGGSYKAGEPLAPLTFRIPTEPQ